jgi:hypothetical protein
MFFNIFDVCLLIKRYNDLNWIITQHYIKERLQTLNK